jgi:hypothetical protein
VLLGAPAGARGTPAAVAAVIVRDGTPGASVIASVVLLGASAGARGTPAVVAAVVVRDGTPGASVAASVDVRICVVTSLPASTIPYTPLWFVWSGLVAKCVVVVASIGGVTGGEAVGARSVASAALALALAPVSATSFSDFSDTVAAGCDLASTLLSVVPEKTIGGSAMSRSENRRTHRE